MSRRVAELGVILVGMEEGMGGNVVTKEGRVVTLRVHQVDIQVTTCYHQITHR